MLRTVAEFLKRWNRFRNIQDRLGENDYLHRYYLLFKTEDGNGDEARHYPFNAFIHNFKASDDPVLHDHPWKWCSIVLKGGYWEHLADGSRNWRGPGSICFRKATDLHWVETVPGLDTWTLFLHGRKQRKWGFIDDGKWVYWKTYLADRLAKNKG